MADKNTAVAIELLNQAKANYQAQDDTNNVVDVKALLCMLGEKDNCSPSK